MIRRASAKRGLHPRRAALECCFSECCSSRPVCHRFAISISQATKRLPAPPEGGASREYDLRTTSDDVVAALGHALCQRIGAPRYDLWFRAKTKFDLEPGRLRVGVPNRFFQDWLQKTFTDDLAAVAAELVGETPEVTFVIDPELFQAARQREETAVPLDSAILDGAQPEPPQAAPAAPGPSTSAATAATSLVKVFCSHSWKNRFGTPTRTRPGSR